jgi:hypothetical protein
MYMHAPTRAQSTTTGTKHNPVLLDAVVAGLEVAPDIVAQHFIEHREMETQVELPEEKHVYTPLEIDGAVELAADVIAGATLTLGGGGRVGIVLFSGIGR